MTKELGTTGLDAQQIGIFSNSRISSQDHFVDLTPEAIREILRYGPKFVEARAIGTTRSRHTVLRCRSA